MIYLYFLVTVVAVVSASPASTHAERDKRNSFASGNLLTVGHGVTKPGGIIAVAENAIGKVAETVGQVILTAAQVFVNLVKSLEGKTEAEQLVEFRKYKQSELCPLCKRLPEQSQQQTCVNYCTKSGWTAPQIEQ